MFIAYGVVLTAIGMDLRDMRISNRLILSGIIIALVRRWFCGGLGEVFTGLFQISFPVILLYLLFLIGALGAGDIKLFSVIGGLVQFHTLLRTMVYAFLAAGLYSLAAVVYYLWKDKKIGCHKIHFSVAIGIGLFLAHMGGS